jgi:hypothetical protein
VLWQNESLEGQKRMRSYVVDGGFLIKFLVYRIDCCWFCSICIFGYIGRNRVYGVSCILQFVVRTFRGSLACKQQIAVFDQVGYLKKSPCLAVLLYITT